MIIRVQKGEDPYARIDKVPINDTRLSWKARGLLLYLLSKPDGWKVRISHLANQAPDGERAVRSGIKELIAAGYMVQTVQRENGKIVSWDYDVYERPRTKKQTEESDQSEQMPESTPLGQNSKVEQSPKNTPFGENLHVQNLHVQNGTLLTNENKVTNEKNKIFSSAGAEPETMLGPDEYPVKPVDEMTKREFELYVHEVGERLWAFWNAQGPLITHRTQGVRAEMYKRLKPRLKEGRTLPEIKNAIRTLAELIEDPEYLWSYRGYSLPDFLKRGQGQLIDRFNQPKESFPRVKRPKAGNVINDREDELKRALEERMGVT